MHLENDRNPLLAACVCRDIPRRSGLLHGVHRVESAAHSTCQCLMWALSAWDSWPGRAPEIYGCECDEVEREDREVLLFNFIYRQLLANS